MEKKRGIMLLKALVFHYHGLDHDERKLLEDYARDNDGYDELSWSMEFISKDYLSAFDRAREFLKKVFLKLDEKERLKCILEVWEDNHKKGYVTEMETMAIINIAKDWMVHKDFLIAVNS